MMQAAFPGMEPIEYGGELEYWSTPRWAVEAVLPVLDKRMARSTQWELVDPGCGRGEIMRVLAAERGDRFSSITGVELDDVRYFEAMEWAVPSSNRHVVKRDFLKWSGDGYGIGGPFLPPRIVVGNPPYGPSADWVQHAIELVTPSRGIVAMLLQHDFATGVDRAKQIHDKWESGLYPLRRRPDFGGEHSTGMRPFTWFVWDLASPFSEWRVIG